MSDAAIAVIVTGVIQAIGMVLGYLKLRHGTEQAKEQVGVVEKKIDNNTQLTKAGTTAAVKTAQTAVATAAEAKEATQNVADSINRKLNGGIDAAIKPVREDLMAHEKKMAQINQKFVELTDYVHKRNHDVLDALGVLSNRVAAVLVMLERQQKQGEKES